MSYKFIELFAGCGGMSLGLETAGFDLYLANELSSMAGETYAYNILNENLKQPDEKSRTFWLQSQYRRHDICRLRENPTEYYKGKYFDLSPDTDIKGSLLIGDINTFNQFLKKSPHIVNNIQKESIDLVSGGPPCQSFSLAGKREKDNKRNQLPWSFAEFVEIVKPKTVLLENVTGILRPFNDKGGKYYAWFEVAKAFCLKGYVPICMHINAKYFDLPQNRPRFIMLAIRRDLTESLERDEVFDKALNTYNRVQKYGEELVISEEDDYYELNTKRDIELFKKSKYLISPKCIKESDHRSVYYAIDFLKALPNLNDSINLDLDPYHRELDFTFAPPTENYTLKNHNHRGHSIKIKNRFKFLKLVEGFENGDKNKLIHALKTGSIVELDSILKDEVVKKLDGVSNISELEEFISNCQSKKHSQRALKKDKPAPAALSIPDDVCHYDENQNRTLTIREMARIQSFPDWFEFRAKDTTGGKNRRFEVPNYTQVGNAVPPLLAKALGEWIKEILNPLKNEV